MRIGFSQGQIRADQPTRKGVRGGGSGARGLWIGKDRGREESSERGGEKGPDRWIAYAFVYLFGRSVSDRSFVNAARKERKPVCLPSSLPPPPFQSIHRSCRKETHVYHPPLET